MTSIPAASGASSSALLAYPVTSKTRSPGRRLTTCVGELAAVHPGQAYVRQQQVDWDIGLKDAQTVRAILRLQDSASHIAQDLDHLSPDNPHVFDDQDALSGFGDQLIAG